MAWAATSRGKETLLVELDRRSVLLGLAGLVEARPAAAQIVVRTPKLPWETVKFTLREGDNVWPGLAIRVPGKAPGESSIYAISTICPHQGCQFEFETDYREVSGKIGKALEHPVLFCHCHMSTYDPTDEGRVIHGPAQRPPFRFDFREEGETLVITGLIGTAREH